MSYIGNSPGIGQGQTFFYTLGAGATSVSGADALGRTLTYTPGLFMIVSLNGTVLNPNEYTATNGTSITFVGWTASAGDELFVYAFGAFALADMVRLSLGLNDLPDKDAALLNLGLSANGRSLVKAANYSAMLDLFGFSAFFKTLIDDPDQATLRASIGIGSVDYQAFTTVGANTWTKPAGATANDLVIMFAWGAGGGASTAFGGGGGACTWFMTTAGRLNATESVSVGAGGTAGGASGGNGGTSSVNVYVVAGGGGGGTNASGGGAGGGQESGAAGVTPGNGYGVSRVFAGGTLGQTCLFGGGAGANNSQAASQSFFGGAGGGSATAGLLPGAFSGALGTQGGTGVTSGTGGAGGVACGGGAGPTAGGAGGRGEVRIWTIKVG